MFTTFLRFELGYWLRGAMVWVFLAILTALFLAVASSDRVQVGAAVGTAHRNAPYAIQNYHAITALLASLMITAFVNSAASRDFLSGTAPLLFSKPLRKWPFLLGRFTGSTAIALIPMLGVSLGILLAPLMPWTEPHRFGPISWGAHLWGVLVFTIPNTFLISSLMFAVAVLTRNSMASFLSAILMLVAYGIAGSALEDLDSERLGALLDPFGIRAFAIETKYWTLSDRQTQYLTFAGNIGLNRILWTAVGAVIFLLSAMRFSFAERSRPPRHSADSDERSVAKPLPKVRISSGFAVALRQCLSQARIELAATARSPVFIVILVFALANMTPALAISAPEGFGLASLPVTYQVIDLVRGSMYLFLIAIITFYAGVLVWKEREARLDDIYDALPHPTPVVMLGKLAALLGIVIAIQVLGVTAGVLSQSLKGYYRYQWSLYASEMLGWDLLQFTFLCVLAFFFHVISPHKVIGYFLFIVSLLLNAFLWSILDVETSLVKYGNVPSYIYSDLYGYRPFFEGMLWFAIYWSLIAAMIVVVSLLLWQRGRETRYIVRLAEAARRWQGSLRPISAALIMGSVGVGIWIAYNTTIVNKLRTPEDRIRRQVSLEKEWSKLRTAPLPTVLSVKYDIELFPERRAMRLHGEQRITNRTAAPLEQVPITVDEGIEVSIEIERATLESSDEEANLRFYRFSPPLAPGEVVSMTFDVSYEPKGFENEVTRSDLVQNGTFFDNGVCPQFGYDASRELSDPNARRRYGMGEPRMMPALDPQDLISRSRNYLGSQGDWVTVETNISTSSDQIAIAPGSLVERRQEGNRNHFRYVLDHPSLNFYSFISADYKVQTQEWNGVSLEVYYHPDHHWNVDNMLRSMRDSLEYYSEAFGPYRHRQARIVEFPRVATFAQAFPGTMPYSEGIGFIADIAEPDDIDMVYYVVAHEIAHQWWAHQVVGAEMEGATLLSETLAQYSALMVMERTFGRDMMRKFLTYEMDSYLRSRGTELLAERPLRQVDASQGYVHYRKGSVVMYQLKELIGEDAVNRALRELVDRFAYQGPPYPTSEDLIEALRRQTPEIYEAVLHDLFNSITLFGNRVVSATATPQADGKFEIVLTIECRKYRADANGEETEAVIDDWIEIGAFAPPEEGRRYGRTLHRERLRINTTESTHRFVVEELPEFVGVDPFALLIDRVPEDNLKRPILTTGASTTTEPSSAAPTP